MKHPTAVAIIPARGGSKRIPRKNMRSFLGQPMLARAIRMVRQSQSFNRIVVSSDDVEILALARSEGAEIIERPVSLADDHTGTAAVVQHAITTLGLDNNVLVACIYPCTPLLRPQTLAQACTQCIADAAVFAACSYDHPPQRALRTDNRGRLVWLDATWATMRTQDLPELLHDSGQFYVQMAARWQQTDDILNNGIGVVLSADEAVDIDTEDDWMLAENLYVARQRDSAKASAQVLFRVDAGHNIGSGHVMRCLTLSHWLSRFGYRSHYLCRDMDGHMSEMIMQGGHNVILMPKEADDAVFSQKILLGDAFDWVVVDHYELDQGWYAIVPSATKIMVIDDLADRQHRADIILNQNLAAQAAQYEGLVSDQCKLLCGSEYALLRPDFAAWRQRSLGRQARRDVQQTLKILVNFGGMDEHNYTSSVICLLREELPNAEISVVLGGHAPHRHTVQTLAQSLVVSCHVDVRNMAELLSHHDWVIGAAGSSLWERCCLGIPSLLLVQADNQQQISEKADAAGVTRRVADMRDDNWRQSLKDVLPILTDITVRLRMSLLASSVCDGRGVAKVLSQMIGK